ncbi:CRISPR-associated helicase Cas3' [Tessaracoccus caeni]|uniref:CRISPR-associated helicase Cas3' n=1 Tax=Tessaracoccus caeni TaxID=3031239 RepID=UPI0023DA3AC5|nr:CRISPR-associated helicase Cas3' [Tessaracoccus caeni]MDF1487393.1 CRISPR-associated helicase Cas3' [Tessaracoccus caeni]
MWSEAARSIWGKLDRESSSWLPLTTHLTDAHAVAGLLWDNFLADSIKSAICTSMGLSHDEGRALVSWLTGVHDIGKASPAFAFKAEAAGSPAVLDRMRDAGLFIHHADTKIGHATVGQAVLRTWLKDKYGTPIRVGTTWASVVGGHHGRNPSDLDVRAAANTPNSIGTGRWSDVRDEILDAMASLSGPHLNLAVWTQNYLPVPAQTLLTSIVIVADWIASNQDYFPYQDEFDTRERAEDAYERLALPGPWRPKQSTDVTALFDQRFPTLRGSAPRAIQVGLVEAALSCKAPPLLIVEEAMGQGKTEAAYLAAEVLAARFGLGGVFFGLPTMATANPMFTRTLEWLSTAVGTEDASVALAHGKAALNEQYTGMLRSSRFGEVYDDDTDGSRGQAVVNAWLRGRRKAGLSSFVVGTIDQALFLGLKAKHVVLRHLGLAAKVVVIDEVHAADTYMRQYLKRVLTWLSAHHTPVILMSATLPPDQRDEYVAAYATGRGDQNVPPTDRTDAYPRITRYDGSRSNVPVVTTTSHTPVQLERIADDPITTIALLDDLLADGGCAGIICNTVRRAQDIYHTLQEHFGKDVVLLHSRFLAPHRAAKEATLVNQLGRDSQRPQRLIVVGTQVLEQSLDIDFDVMISDLAPIDLLLQRVGRLHRHTTRRRPPLLTSPALYIRGVIDWAEQPPVSVRSSRSVYGEAPLLRSAAVLDSRTSIHLPKDIPTLVRTAYDPTLVAPAGWEERWNEAEAAAASKSAQARSRAQTYMLASPESLSSLTGWLDVAESDPERAEEKGRSQVRDSEDSLEVLVLWRDSSGQLRVPSYARSHAGALVPEGLPWGTTGTELSIAKAMASCTLSLPIQLTNDKLIDQVIDELERQVDASGWQRSPWVAGQLILVFDDVDKVTLGGFDLQYDAAEGLLITRSESAE